MQNIPFYSKVEEVLAYIDPLRMQGKTLVTTNGCFDILHAGHIQYLQEAAALGDMLVVGVNSDSVVRKLKGPNRPVQPEQDRVRLIAALRMVHAAFIFPEDDPRTFLEILKPNLHVKGGDYTADILERPIVEKHGGKIVIVSFKADRSTTRIINKIGTK